MCIDKYAGSTRIDGHAYILHQNCYACHETIINLLDYGLRKIDIRSFNNNMVHKKFKKYISTNQFYMNCDMCNKKNIISINRSINQLDDDNKKIYKNKLEVIISNIIREHYKHQHGGLDCPKCLNATDINSICLPIKPSKLN